MVDQTTTIEQLASDYAGATGQEWMAVSFQADAAGRMDLVAYCREMAAAAYEQDDE